MMSDHGYFVISKHHKWIRCSLIKYYENAFNYSGRFRKAKS
jgi:hypothetical protein